MAASSCCTLPLVLFGLGVSGAWIGNLTQLAPLSARLYRRDTRLPGVRLLASIPVVQGDLHRR